jgi:NADPH-dependent curcumin reductase CurA
MATFKEDFTAKYQTTKDADIEETTFAAGDEVSSVQTWDDYVLVKDDDGHFYNVPKDKIDA